MLTNEAEEAHDGAEDLHNENFDEQVRVGGVGKSGGRTGNTNRDTTQKVAHTDGETTPEQRVP